MLAGFYLISDFVYGSNSWKTTSLFEIKDQFSIKILSVMQPFLNESTSDARTSLDHFFQGFFFFLSLDLHELWRSLMSICLFTLALRQWATLVVGWVTAWVHYSCQPIRKYVLTIDIF